MESDSESNLALDNKEVFTDFNEGIIFKYIIIFYFYFFNNKLIFNIYLLETILDFYG